MAATLFTIHKARTATAKFTDADGNQTEVDGVSQWASTNPGVASVTPSEDGKTCRVSPDAIGTSQIQCIADPKFGPEQGELILMGDIEVKPGEAVAGVIEFGPEE